MPSSRPFAVWAEYIAADADGAIQRREARQVFLPRSSKESFGFSALRPEARIEGSALHKAR